MLVDSLPNHRTMYIRGRSIGAIEVVVAELSMIKIELVHERGVKVLECGGISTDFDFPTMLVSATDAET